MSNDEHYGEEELTAAGWDSIDAKTSELYPGVEPFHYGTIIKWSMGGPDPLDGVSIFRNSGDLEHWHYISYGLTELYGKESDNDEFSGYGFEFTFRLAAQAGEDQPPTWPIGLMQNLARYVFQTGNVFDYGHRIPLNSPICKDEDTLLCGAMFAVDPQLGVCQSENGQFTFLQIIGTTSDELDAAEAWNTKRFIEILAQHNPLMVTDLRRRSIMETPAIADLVKSETEKDGSSCGTLYVGDSEISTENGAKSGRELTFKLVPKDFSSVRRLIAGRLLHGRQLTLVSPDSSLLLVPAEQSDWKDEEDGYVISMSPSLVQDVLSALDSVKPRANFADLKNFVIATK